MALNQEAVKGIVTELLRQSAGFEDDEIAAAHKAALDYYFMRPRGDEVADRCQFVSGDVSAMVEANLAQMIDSLSGDRLVEFEADDEEDEQDVALESDVCAAIIMDDNDGFLMFVEAIKDALLQRNGICKGWIEEKPRTKTREFDTVTPDAFVELTEREGYTVDILKYDLDTGYLKIRETKNNRRLRVGALPPENFVYTRDWHTLDLADIPLCGERHVEIRSNLYDRGFPKSIVDELKPFVAHTQSESARNPRGAMRTQTNLADKALDLIEWYELCVLLDEDGDGIAERRYIALVPNEAVLDDYEVESVDYAAGAVILNPHRFLGVSLYDKLKQTQDYRTALKRAVGDNSNATNKSRVLYLKGKVNQDDLEAGAVNKNIAVNPPVQDVRTAAAALTVPDISAGIQLNLEAAARERAELGGAALDIAQANVQISERVGSQGIDRAYSVMEQLAAMMTRILAESLVRGVWLMVHRMLRENFDTEIRVKRRGKWHTVTPSDWPERTRARVKLGMSPGERARKAQSYEFILDAQLKLASQPGMSDVLVNMQGFFQALMDWARVREVPNPEQYFLDPDSDASKKVRKQLQQKTAAEKKAQQNLMDVALGLEQLRISIDKRNADADRVLAYFEAVLKSETDVAKIVGDATAKLEQIQAQGETRGERESEDETGS